jgi:hypothetical protein
MTAPVAASRTSTATKARLTRPFHLANAEEVLNRLSKVSLESNKLRSGQFGKYGDAAGQGAETACQVLMAADPAAGCVIQITVIAMRVCYLYSQEDGAMANIRSYDGWWDLSLIDDRNERALLSAFVAVVAVWAMTFLFALF